MDSSRKVFQCNDQVTLNLTSLNIVQRSNFKLIETLKTCEFKASLARIQTCNLSVTGLTPLQPQPLKLIAVLLICQAPFNNYVLMPRELSRDSV